MEKPIKMDDLGVPLFSETPIWLFLYMFLPRYFSGGIAMAIGPPPKIRPFAWKDSCHGVGNPSGVGISKDQEPHATQLQRIGLW